MKTVRYLFTVCVLVCLHSISYGQVKNDTIPPYIKGKVVLGERVLDTLPPKADAAKGRKRGKDIPNKVDSPVVKKKHDPHKATLYSTFCPGLGQIYNRKYWKLPLVYAAVGIPAYTYFYNRSWYKKCQYALTVVLNGITDSATIANTVDPKLQGFVKNKQDNYIREYRNEFRKDQDYSVIFFLLFWGLQIVDATVDAHLMNFDISPELSLHLQEGSGVQGNLLIPGSASPAGIGLVFDLHKARYKSIPLP